MNAELSAAPTPGEWTEFVIGVKWASDETGSVNAYTRQSGGDDALVGGWLEGWIELDEDDDADE